MFGFEIRREDQSIVSDGTYPGSVFLEMLTFAPGVSGSKSYPEVPGNALYFLTMQSGYHTITVDADGLGQGRLNWAGVPGGGATRVAVFAKKLVATAGYGMVLYNDIGEVAAVHTHSLPQYIGTLQPDALPIESIPLPDGGFSHRHAVNIPAVGSSDMLVMLLCPVPHNADAWYSWVAMTTGSGGPTEMRVAVPSGAAYDVPTLHMYSVNKPPTVVEPFGITMYKANGELAYSSSPNNLAVRSEFKFDFPLRGASNTYDVAGLPTFAGVFMPHHGIYEQTVGGRVHEYQSMVRRVGNQITFKNMLLLDNPAEPSSPSYYFEIGNRLANHCIVVDLAKYGASSLPSVPGPIQSIPVITSHPSSVSVTEGTAVSFTVVASGNPSPQYRWYRNNVLIGGATSATYSKIATSSDNGAVFKCDVYNIKGTVTSAGATLTITASYTEVFISSHPSNAVVQEGGFAAFYVSAGGTQPITYQWYDAGFSGFNYVLIPGATSSGYAPSTTSNNNGRRYFCTARNVSPGGVPAQVSSNMATLTITPAATDAYIASHPSSVVTGSGNTANFFVSAGGTGPFNYQWYFNSSPLSGRTSATLSIVAGAGTVGNYRCLVSGATGVPVFSNFASLSLGAPPSVSSQPTGLTVDKNGSAVFTFGVSGATTYEWYRQSTIDDTGPVYVGGGSSHSATTSIVGIWEIYCIASNSYGYVQSNTVVLQVREPSVKPVIHTHPASATVIVNSRHSFGIVATNVAGGYQWYRNGVAFGPNSSSCPADTSSVGTSTYWCRVFNGTEYTDSSTATLTVTEDTSWPQIVTYPVGGQVAINSVKTLSITVRYADSVQWYRDGVHQGGTASGGQTEFTSTRSVPTSTQGSYVYRADVTHINGRQVSATVIVTVGQPQ